MAYTKYSLTPANNNAAPPDGAPEGMLPSAVNDTMRDMMAQIRDVGDGIRGGTYTMTAPIITGGTITGVALTGNTFTSPVISGGSINNTPIGATTASTGAFSTLAYSSTLTGGTGVVNLGSGQFYKDASGNVGIGTITPAHPLDIRSNFVSQVTIGAISGNTNASLNLEPTGTGVASIGPASAFPLAFRTDAVERMRITSTGDVGIGTSSPATPLNIVGSTTAKARLNVSGYAGLEIGQNADLTSEINQKSGSALLLKTSDTERMRIDSSGNVGIGTSSPAVKLDVVGNSAAVQASESGGASVRIAAGGSTGFTGTYSNHPLAFLTNSTEAMRIDTSGNLLVGTTTVTSQGWVQLTTSNTKYSIVSRSSVSGAGAPLACVNSAGTEVGSITFNNTTTTYATSSDYRLKENIALMTGALAIVSALKPVTYKWKADGTNGQGFIAHELQAVVPDAVTGEKDAVDSDGNPKYQGIDTSFLVATLTAAIQEQQTLIENLTTRLNALEGK